jgi:inosose dehydratase
MKFANAPVSYGVFGDLTLKNTITTSALLQTMRNAGYQGSELGPPGFFGTSSEMLDCFAAAGLDAVGVYVPLNTQAMTEVLNRDLDRMRLSFDEIEAIDSRALVILADEGNQDLLKVPRKNPDMMLDSKNWDRLVHTLMSAAAEARGRGLEVSFHPHVSTFVELPEEIDRLLEDTDLSLTFDIGHIVLAGGNGVDLFRRWRTRVNHVHIKDVRVSVLENARASGASDFDQWWASVATPLGEGDVDLAGFADALRETNYDRWIVVEQDCSPLTMASMPTVFADQASNLLWLEKNLGSARPENNQTKTQ